MFVIIGTVIVFGSVILGYVMHHGDLAILWQPTEVIIICGAALGTLLLANPMNITMGVVKGAIGTLKGSKINKTAFLELMKMLYELFILAKKDGLIALEPHVENPESSSIFSKYTSFIENHHAVDFTCDTFKVLLNGGVPAHDLEDLMDADLTALHEEEHKIPAALNTVSDAFPGLGIVAAVLGVVITMGKINEPPEVIGHNVAAALVGTFLGILMSYGFFGPLTKNMEHMLSAEGVYMNCIKAAILSFAKGAPAAVAIEYGRRSISPHDRPTFKETEDAVKNK